MPEHQPRSLPDILDAGVRLYRAQFLRFTAVAAIGALPLLLAQSLLNRLLLPAFSVALLWLISFAIALVNTIIFGNLLAGLLVSAAAQAHQGLPIAIGAAVRTALRRYPVLLLASLGPLLIERFIGLVVGVLQQPLTTLIISGDLALLGGWLLPLVLVLLAGPFVLGLLWFYGQLFLYAQAVVIEGCGPLAALRRSWALLAADRMRGPLVVAATRTLAHLCVWLPLFTAMFISFRVLAAPELYQWLGPLVGLAGTLLAQPLLYAIDTVLYYEQAAQLPAGPTAPVEQYSVL